MSLCPECKQGDHSYHSGPQLAFICIGCSCEWMPEDVEIPDADA